MSARQAQAMASRCTEAEGDRICRSIEALLTRIRADVRGEPNYRSPK